MSYRTNKKHRERIDNYLRKMHSIQANLGTDSTQSDIKNAYRDIARYEEKIKAVDEDFYREICPYDEME